MTRKTKPIRLRRRYAKLAGLMAAVMLLTGVCSTLPVSAGASANNNAQIVGTYTVCRIKNAATGRYLEYGNPLSHTTGTLVSTKAKRSESDSLRNHQLWCVMQIASPDDGEAYMNENEFGLPGVADSGQTYVRKIRNYRIMPYNYMGVALDVRGGGADDGALIETYPIAINGNTEDNPAQIFQIDVSTVSPDRMYIASKCSGTSSDGTYYKGYVTDTGSSVIQHQWDSSYHTNNKTRIFEEVIKDEPEYFIRNKHSKKYLTVPNGNMANGTRLTQQGYHGGNMQQWKIQMQSDGTYKIASVLNKSYYIDTISSNSIEVCIWTDVGQNSMKWKIMRNENGTFRIGSWYSGFVDVLTVSGGSTANGAAIILNDYGNDPKDQTANEQWELIPLRNDKLSGSKSDAVKYSGTKPSWAPSQGNLTATFYDGDVNIVKTVANITFSNTDTPNSGMGEFGMDVSAHRYVGSGDASQMSAYFVITNLPNPVVDIENDKGEKKDGVIVDNDWYYEESEAVASQKGLVAGVQYYLHTYWQDYRLGNYGGNFKLDCAKNQDTGQEYDPWWGQTGGIAVINYGSTGGKP